MAANQDAFLEWAFEQSGRNPLPWQYSAKDLLEAANAVKSRVYNSGDGMMHSLAAVQAMLLGFAIECLLKGMWIKKHQPWIDENRQHGLTKNGKFVGIPGAGDHDLKQLADAVQVTVSNEETDVLQRLSAFIMYAGRYPVSMRWQQMRPTKTKKGGAVSPNFFQQLRWGSPRNSQCAS